MPLMGESGGSGVTGGDWGCCHSLALGCGVSSGTSVEGGDLATCVDCATFKLLTDPFELSCTL